MENFAVALFNGLQQRIEAVVLVILTVEVEHHARDTVQYGLDPLHVPLAQPRKGPRRVGENKMGVGHTRIEAQPDRLALRLRLIGIALELVDRVEDDLVAIVDGFIDLMIGPRHRIGMGLAAEFLAAEFEFIER